MNFLIIQFSPVSFYFLSLRSKYYPHWEPGSSVSIVSDNGLEDRAIEVDPRQGHRIFPLTSVSRPALGPTQPPVQWVPGSFPRGQSAAGP
jgi:hypothetical protein